MSCNTTIPQTGLFQPVKTATPTMLRMFVSVTFAMKAKQHNGKYKPFKTVITVDYPIFGSLERYSI